MPRDDRPVLRVEGKDDKFVIENLLSRHGIDHTLVDIKWSKQGGGDDAGGKDPLLDGMRLAVTTSTGKAVGFVLDADRAPENRWRGVRTRLDGVLALPDEIPEHGFVGNAEAFESRVGVWLMPDNRSSGAIEEFLQGLVEDEDPLLQLAETSTTSASERGAAFPVTRRPKAVMHTWLAWQERPGLPYGLAVTARYFRHDSPAALAFVEWFQRVFVPTTI